MSKKNEEQSKIEYNNQPIKNEKYGRNFSVNRSSKDSVFTDLFSHPEYLLELYQSLFPEDKDCTKEDLEILSLENIFINGPYNDLGFLVKDKLMILIEAQSTWNPNIPMRMLTYLTRTYRDYALRHKFNNYGSKLEKYPKPKFYVVYTGDTAYPSDKLHLNDCFISDGEDEESSVDCTVKVITSVNSSGILTEYISFCKIFNDMIRKYGYVLNAITQTIRICKDKDILKKYLESREVEVTRMLENIFDQEVEFESYARALEREMQEATEKAVKEAVKEATEKACKETEEKVSKETAERVSKETAERVSKETAERVSKETAERVSKNDAEKYIHLCIELKLSKEETIRRVSEAFELLTEESEKLFESCKNSIANK